MHADFPLWHAEDISSNFALALRRPASENGLSVLISADYPYRVFQQTPEFSKMFGFTDEELRMVSLRVIFGPDTDVKRLQATISNVVRSGEEAGCFTFYKKNGDDVKFPLRGYLTNFDGCEACRLDFAALEFAAGNDLPSGSRSETKTEPSQAKPPSPESPDTFIMRACMEQQHTSPAAPVTGEVDRAVLLHIRAIRRAAAAAAPEGLAKGCRLGSIGAV